MKLTKRILGAAITVAVITSLTSCGDSVEEGGAVNSLKDSMNSATAVSYTHLRAHET